ncbi:MAG: histidine--tRNA ligase, partial [Acidobacteriota bacterium]
MVILAAESQGLMYRAIKGTKDILPEEVSKWQFVERKAAAVFSLYGFREIRTPIFEETKLFERSIGTATDIVNKEMYTFRVGNESLTLRPENTAPVVRAYVQHSLQRRSSKSRYYYIGPMFRYERPQKGRQRQFHQIGVEVLAEKSPFVDAEVIAMSAHFLEALGIKNFKTAINSVGCANCRKNYRETLRGFLKPLLGKLCGDCNRRYAENPLRVFDCKVESCKRELQNAPVLIDSLCQECQIEFQKVIEYLKILDVDYIIKPVLVL